MRSHTDRNTRRALRRRSTFHLTALGLAAILAVAPAVLAQTTIPINPRFRVQQPIAVGIGTDPTLLSDRPNLQSYTVADVDGDGLRDIVAIDPDFDRVAVYVSQGDGSFDLVETPESGDVTPTVVAVADVMSPFADGNNSKPDNKPDIIVGGDDGTIAVLARTQDGHFVLEQTVEPDSTSAIVGMVTGNFDGKTGIDVALLDESGVVLLCNDNSGSLIVCGAEEPIEINGGSDEIVKIVGGNFNGDANQDLAVLDKDTSQVFVLFGNGDATFNGPGSGIGVKGEANESSDLAVGRMDNDGNDDLVVINSGDFGDQFGAVLLGLSSGRFEQRGFVAQFGATSLTLGDFDGGIDRTIDAIVGSEQEPVGVSIGDGQGDLGDPFSPSGVGGLGSSVGVIQSGNINNDALPDLVSLNVDGDELRIALNVSNEATPTPGSPTATITGTVLPTSTPTATVPTSTATATPTPTPMPTANYGRCNVQVAPNSLSSVTTGTFDQGDSADIAVADPANHLVRIILNTSSVSQSLRNCAMTMMQDPLPGNPMNVTVGSAPNAVTAFDPIVRSEQRRSDLAVAGPDGITILRGDGSGGFTALPPIDIGGEALAIVADFPSSQTDATARGALDLNGDRNTDLVVVRKDTNGDGDEPLAVLHGNGDGTFSYSSADDLSLGGRPTTLTAADYNRDDCVDLVAGRGSDAILLIRNRQMTDGACLTTFTQRRIDTGGTVVSLASGFFDNDRFADLFVARGNSTAGVGEIYRFNSTRGVFERQGALITGKGPVAAGVGFFDTTRGWDAVVASNVEMNVLGFGFGDDAAGFQQPPVLPFLIPSAPRALAVDAIDSDSMPDVVTANSDGTVTILLSSVPPPTPTPTFTPLPTDTPSPTQTGIPTGTGSPTDTPTCTPTASPTFTTTGTKTITPGPSPTQKLGNFQLNGGCSIDAPQRQPAFELAGMLFVLGLLAFRRRAGTGAATSAATTRDWSGSPCSRLWHVDRMWRAGRI